MKKKAFVIALFGVALCHGVPAAERLWTGGDRILGGTYRDVGVLMRGGALETAAGTSNAVGAVSLTEDSVIVVGEGAVLTFADSSAASWAAGKTLSVTGDVGRASVRFGTGAAALTEAQQLVLFVNGEMAMLDRNGYVRAGLPGTKMFIK